MPQISPLRLDDGTLIYIEVTQDVDAPGLSEPSEDRSPTPENPRETTRADRGPSKGWKAPFRTDIEEAESGIHRFKIVENTIRAYTHHTLNAFKQVPISNVDKVTLEFGIELAGEAGIPYVTKGTAKSNLKITVECSFPNTP